MEYKFTAGWEEKGFYDQLAEFVEIIAHLKVNAHQKILWMRFEEKAELFQPTMKEWERLTTKPKPGTEKESTKANKAGQGYWRMKRRKDGKDGYLEVPKFE